MSDKVLIKNNGDLFEINPKEIIKSFRSESDSESTEIISKTLKNLKYITKSNRNSYHFCFEFENFSKDISVKRSKEVILSSTYNLNSLLARLTSFISPDNLKILMKQIIKRKQEFETYLNAGIESADGYYLTFNFPVKFYHKIYLYGNVELPSNPSENYLNGYSFEFLTKFSKTKNLRSAKSNNRLILPNIYSSNELCLGTNRVEKYADVYEYSDVLNIFKDSVFNGDLNATHNILSVKKSLKANLKYIIKHKIKDENLKNAYIELFQKEEAISNMLGLNTNDNVYMFLNLFYLLDVD